MYLNQIVDNPGAHKKSFRIGRGIGSGCGKTSCRGVKGQGARSGVSLKGFEGGQMPLMRRLPKRGFCNIFRKHYVSINLYRLEKAIEEKRLDPTHTIDAESLRKAGIIKNIRDGIRLLGVGGAKTAMTVQVSGVSASARKAIESAGGRIVMQDNVRTNPLQQKVEKALMPKKSSGKKSSSI